MRLFMCVCVWNMFVSAEDLDLEESNWDTHVITGALKLFFRELQEPLFPYNLFNEFISGISEFVMWPSAAFAHNVHSCGSYHKIKWESDGSLWPLTLLFSVSCALIQKSLIITINFHTWKIWWCVCHNPTMTQWRCSSAIYASMLIV